MTRRPPGSTLTDPPFPYTTLFRAAVSWVATSRDEISIEAPSESIRGPDSTRTVTLNAKAGSIGVHPLTLRLADAEGRPFGEEEQMNVRSNTVGKEIGRAHV